MTQKSPILANKYIRWLLPAGLLLVLVAGFLQTPEVKTLLNPDFLWTDQLYRLQKEELKVIFKLYRGEILLNSLKNNERPEARDVILIKKETISITNSLRLLDAMLANLGRELQAGLRDAPPARRAQLHAYLRQVETMQRHCEAYHRRLREVSQKMQHF